ncbi:hypothetical protein SNE40_000365 [Patella caerulea]|uniref:Fibrinogen C-terminal domain-containing protein n=1 Tax=Patella caerulea TaxID=87958 RepID=A0AAN8Q260_PATCE
MLREFVFFVFILEFFILTNGLFFSKIQRGDITETESKEEIDKKTELSLTKNMKFNDKKDSKDSNVGFSEKEDDPTLSSLPPVSTGLYATIQKLQEQVLNLHQLHDKERTKIRRLERRVRECKDGVAVTKSDVVQLKQSVREMTSGYSEIQESFQDIKLQTSGVGLKLDQRQKDYRKLHVLATSNAESLNNLWNNFTELSNSKNTDIQHPKSIKKDVKILSARQRQQSNQIAQLQSIMDNLVTVSINKTKTIVTVNLSNGTNITKNILEEIDNWDSGSGEVEKEYIVVGDREGSNREEEDILGFSGDGELPDLFPDYEDLDYLDNVIDLRDNISNIENSLQNLENQVRESVSTNIMERVTLEVKNLIQKERESIDIMADDRDEAFAQLQEQYNKMVDKIKVIDEKIQSIQLGDFMKNLQESLINFTQNVITLDQWKTASSQIINSTQFNQHQIMQLKGEIINTTNIISKLKWRTSHRQDKVDQQYRVLQMHIINLNNSMQDLREHVTYIATMQSSRRPSMETNGNTRYLPPSTDVLSRLEDLGLQITYNENRIAKMETRVLNQSLYECQKANNDLFQDSKLLQLDHDIQESKKSATIMKGMLKRLDRAIYRVHSYAKNSSDVINTLQSKFFSWDVYIPIIQLLRQEVSNLLYTLPIDCNSYFRRGYTDDGIYVIFPPSALQSIKIPCIMDKDGGWTVIQRRINGATKFARSWSEYAVGFGNPMTEFWIGNEFIHLLTSRKNYSLQIEMLDIFDSYWIVDYDYFNLASKEDQYRLSVDGFSGNATDGMAYSNDMTFSTQDKDNDLSSTHCAKYYTAGWWYRHCQYSNLNGRFDAGIVWFNKDWQDWIQLKATVMKIRPQISDKSNS